MKLSTVHFGTTVNSALVEFLCVSFGEHMDEFLLDGHLGVEFLDFMDYFMNICIAIYTYTEIYIYIYTEYMYI